MKGVTLHSPFLFSIMSTKLASSTPSMWNEIMNNAIRLKIIKEI